MTNFKYPMSNKAQSQNDKKESNLTFVRQLAD